jgi:hypothetical protein
LYYYKAIRQNKRRTTVTDEITDYQIETSVDDEMDDHHSDIDDEIK